MLTGWALNPSAKFRYQVDACFPLSDHADYPDLLRTVEEISPKRVFTVHGSTREFAADLRAAGTEAWSLISTDQLGDLFLGDSIPVKFIVFDCRLAENRPLLKEPLTERRKALEQLTLPPNIEIAHIHHATGEHQVDAAFQAARKRLNEGIVAKDPQSTYSPGRRGQAWLKLKTPEDIDTLAYAKKLANTNSGISRSS